MDELVHCTVYQVHLFLILADIAYGGLPALPVRVGDHGPSAAGSLP